MDVTSNAGLPDPPLRTHTPSHDSYPEDVLQTSQLQGTTAHDFLGEQDDRIATELPALSAVHSRRTAARGGMQWALQHEVTRADSEQARQDEEEYRRQGFTFKHYRLVRQRMKWYHPLSAWWGEEVSAKVDPEKRRDHLALERTFLSYLRTSVALSQIGVVIAQLFRLQHNLTPDMTFGYFVTGEPVAACFMGAAVLIVLVGWVRFWRQQRAMIRGKIWAGGWEVYVVMGLTALLCIALFALTLAIAIRHD